MEPWLLIYLTEKMIMFWLLQYKNFWFFFINFYLVIFFCYRLKIYARFNQLSFDRYI